MHEAAARSKGEPSKFDEDFQDGDEEEEVMTDAREEPAEDSEAAGWRRQGRWRFGKGNMRFKGDPGREGKGSAEDRERSPRR